jgi:CRP-like cAMP-binding protein
MNLLIQRLPARERAALLAECRPCPLVTGVQLLRAGQPTRHAWFPSSGFLSLLTGREGTPPLEVGLVGDEGMLGGEVALGIGNVPMDVLVQGAGEALRIGVAPFRKELVPGGALQRLVNSYLFVRMQQLAGMAVCNRFHPIEARLARWLLMSHDRSVRTDFVVTHEFLSHMLGVRRAGVTLAAIGLQDRGLIRYSRGAIQVLHRTGLENAACTCYGVDNASYQREMVRSRRPHRSRS